MRIQTEYMRFKNCWMISSSYDLQAYQWSSQMRCCFSHTALQWFVVLPGLSLALPGAPRLVVSSNRLVAGVPRCSQVHLKATALVQSTLGFDHPRILVRQLSDTPRGSLSHNFILLMKPSNWIHTETIIACGGTNLDWKEEGQWTVAVCRLPSTNRAQVKNQYPGSLLLMILGWLQGARIFIIVDLRTTYHLIQTKEGEQYHNAFHTGYGQFKYPVMMLRSMNTLATFDAFINDCLWHYIDEQSSYFPSIYGRQLDSLLWRLHCVLPWWY